MNEKKLETKEELKSIIDAAFYDFDDYVTYCHDNDIDVTEDVEDFIADAIIKAGYVKQGATDINDGGKSGDCKNCNDHKEINTPTNTPTQNQFTNSELKQIEEMRKTICDSCGIEHEHCGYISKGEWCPTLIADTECLYKTGFRKQIEGKWVNNHCSVCGMTPIGEETWERLDMTPPKYELFMGYCPVCGAKMVGGTE